MFVHVTVANFAISHYMYYIQEFVAVAPGEKDDMLSWMCEKSASEFQKGNAIHSVLGLSKVRVQIFYLANMQIWFEANYTFNTTELNNYFISNESFSVDLGHSPVNFFFSFKIYKEYCKHRAFLRKELRSSKLEKIYPFIDATVELCWLMCAQTPPMQLVFAENKSTVNKSYFRCTGHSGNKVDVCAWPAVILHDGGPVVTRGHVLPS